MMKYKTLIKSNPTLNRGSTIGTVQQGAPNGQHKSTNRGAYQQGQRQQRAQGATRAPALTKPSTRAPTQQSIERKNALQHNQYKVQATDHRAPIKHNTVNAKLINRDITGSQTGDYGLAQEHK